MDNLKNFHRTNYCGDLRLSDAGKTVSLCGWVQRQRDLGGLIFVDLRDRTGLLQLAFERFGFSARTYSRVLKVARTIADLDASPTVRPEHISEAITYRQLDRSDWAERGL